MTTIKARRGPRYRTIEVSGSLVPRGSGGERDRDNLTTSVIDTWDTMREIQRFRSEDMRGMRMTHETRLKWARTQAAQLAADLNRRNTEALNR